jgi:hypothetical protein
MTHLISVDDPPVLTSSGELDRGQCLELLAVGGYGRVVGTDCALPAVHPVSFVLDEQEVIFQALAGTALAATVGNVVAFQADEFDHVTGIGWTVLGIGKPYQLVSGQTRLAIPLWRLTGRRLTRTPGEPARGQGDAGIVTLAH